MLGLGHTKGGWAWVSAKALGFTCFFITIIGEEGARSTIPASLWGLHHIACVFIWLQRGCRQYQGKTRISVRCQRPPKLPQKYNLMKIMAFTLLQAGHYCPLALF